MGWKYGRGRPLSSWLRQMEGLGRRVGTNREQAWALAKEDAEAYRDSWRGAAKAPAAGGASSRSK